MGKECSAFNPKAEIGLRRRTAPNMSSQLIRALAGELADLARRHAFGAAVMHAARGAMSKITR
jgi:hypothetical protein